MSGLRVNIVDRQGNLLHSAKASACPTIGDLVHWCEFDSDEISAHCTAPKEPHSITKIVHHFGRWDEHIIECFLDWESTNDH